MYRHHTFEERLSIVIRILSGESLTSICKEANIDRYMVRQWVRRYQEYGESGLRGTRSYKYSAKDKIKMVEEFIKNQLPLQKICLQYNINSSTIKGWIRKYRMGISLENRQRGRPPKDSMARVKKQEAKTELEKLQEENLRLRAENALLKKVKALVEEEEARAYLNGQKPSTN